jgi:chromosome segregation ATPase
VTGDIIAPQVVIRGLVSGRVLALELIVEDKGQIWGDVWARSLQIKPGGRVRGWVSELTAPLADALESGKPIPEQISPETEDEPADIAHLTSLEALRAELIDALLARKRAERELAEGLPEQPDEEEPEDTSCEQGRSALAQALIQSQDREEALRGNLQELEAELDEMTHRRDDAVALVVEHEQDIQSLREEVEGQRGRIARLLDDLGRANELAGERKRELERLSSTLDDKERQTQEELERMTAELAAAQKELRKRNKLLDDLGNNLVQSQEHVEQQHLELVSLREKVELMSRRDSELQAAADEAQAARKIAEKALRDQESEILRLQAELDVTISDADQDREEIANLERRLAEANEKIGDLQARLVDEAGARRELDRLQEQVDGARRLAEAQRKLAETRSQALAEVQAREEQLLRKQRRLERELAAVENLERGLSVEQSRTLRLELDLEEAKVQIDRLQREQATKQEQFRRVMTAAREQIDKLQSRLEQEESTFVQTQEQMAAWRVESERLEAQLAASQEKNEELQSELHMARSVISELNADLDKEADRLDERDKTVAQLYVELAELRSQSE